MFRLTGGFVMSLMLFLGTCIWATGVHLSIPVVAEDDAFITFRYAENLSNGHGLVYNQGERVFGSSTPLFVVWLTSLKVLFPTFDVPTLAVRTNLWWLLGSAVAFFLVLYNMTKRAPLSLVVATWFLLHPAVTTLSWKGMEAFLLVFLILSGIAALQRGRLVLMAALFGLAAITRPEGMLVLPIAVLAWRQGKVCRPKLFFTALLLPGLAWTIFSTVYFGTPIPHSLIAKAAPLFPTEPGTALSEILTWWARWWAGSRFGSVSLCAKSVAAVASVLGGLGMMLHRDSARNGARQVGFFFFSVVVLYAISNPLLFHWYGANIFPFWVLALVVGLPAIISRTSRRCLSGSAKIEKHLQTIAVSALALTMFWNVGSALSTHQRSVLTLTGFDTRVLGYQKTAGWLNQNGLHTEVVCAPEIGALGFYWKGKVLDSCALVSPEALSYLPCPATQRYDAETAAIPVALVKSFRPDYIVSLVHFIREGLLRSRWFYDNYELIHRVELATPLWQSDAILVYRKKSQGTLRVLGAE